MHMKPVLFMSEAIGLVPPNGGSSSGLRSEYRSQNCASGGTYTVSFSGNLCLAFVWRSVTNEYSYCGMVSNDGSNVSIASSVAFSSNPTYYYLNGRISGSQLILTATTGTKWYTWNIVGLFEA